LQKNWVYLKEKMAPYLLLAPFLAWFILFFAYAFIRVVYFSFTDYNLFNEPVFIGLKNYLSLFKESLFAQAFKNSITFAFIVTTAQTFLSSISLIKSPILNHSSLSLFLVAIKYFYKY